MKLLLLLILFPLGAFGQSAFIPACTGDATHDTAAFNTILTAAGNTNPATISPPYRSNVSQRCNLNTITIPANVTLDNTSGSGIAIASGQTVTVNGPLLNPPGKTIWYGTGTAIVNSPSGGSTVNNPAVGSIGTTPNFRLPPSSTIGTQFMVGDAIPGSSPCTHDGFTDKGALATWNGTQWNCSAVSPSQTFDTSLKSFFNVYLAGGNVTSSAFTNPTLGKLITVSIKQDSTGGRTFVWPTNAVNAPSIDTAVRSTTAASFWYDGSHWQNIKVPETSSNMVAAASLGNKILIANAFPSTYGDEGSRIVNADSACGTEPCVIYHFGGGKITQEVVVRSGHKLILSGGTYDTISPSTGTSILLQGDIVNPWVVNVGSGVEQPTGVPFIMQNDSSLECTGWDTIIKEPTVGGLDAVVKDFASVKFSNQAVSSNISFKNCKVVGANPDFNSSNPVAGLGNCHHCFIEHNYFDGLSSIGAQFGGSSATGNFAQDAWIIDNLFIHCPTQNIAMVNGDNIHIARNIIRDPDRQIGLDPQPGSTQIDVETNVFTDHGSNLSVTDNIIDNSGNQTNGVNQAIAIQCGGSNCINVTVTGNTITGQSYPTTGFIADGGILVFSVTGISVSNNSLIQTSYGISCNQCQHGSMFNNRLIQSPGMGLVSSTHMTVFGNSSDFGDSEANQMGEDVTSDYNTFANNIGFALAPQVHGTHSLFINSHDAGCVGFPNCFGTGPRYNITRNSVIVQTSAGFAITPTTLTANTTLDNFIGTVFANSTGGAFTVKLPALNYAEPGRIYTIKVTAGTNLVTLACDTSNGAQTIDGSATYTGLSTANKYVTVQYGAAGSAKWYVIANN